MTNKERFLAGEIFKLEYHRYQVGKLENGTPFIRKQAFPDYDYYCNIESLDEEKAVVVYIFFGVIIRASIEFMNLNFVEQ